MRPSRQTSGSRERQPSSCENDAGFFISTSKRGPRIARRKKPPVEWYFGTPKQREQYLRANDWMSPTRPSWAFRRAEEEFYRSTANGPVAFTRPGASFAPAALKKPEPAQGGDPC
jgi:hypothetical protein